MKWFIVNNIATAQEEERYFPLDAFDWLEVEYCDIVD